MYRNTSGISLVELLVVTALIGILASVVGPQLLSFAVQGYNANASADLRNAAAAEKAFFADWGVYASSAIAGAPGAAGRILTNVNLEASPPTNATGQIAAGGIVPPSLPSSPIPSPGFQIGISQNVTIEINTSVAPNAGGSYTMVSKNASGDRCFGMDSDMKVVYWINGTGMVSAAGGVAPTAITGINDFGEGYIAGTGVCNGYPMAGQGQLSWTSL